MVCEICGSSNIIKKDGVFACQTCGMQYSADDAKKLLQDVPDEAPVVNSADLSHEASDELQRLYKLARRARDNDDDETAAKMYEQISIKNPEDWEAMFYSSYCRSQTIKVGHIPGTIGPFCKVTLSVLDLIKDNESSLDDVRGILKEISDNFCPFVMSLIRQAVDDDKASVSIDGRFFLYQFGNKIKDLFPDYVELAIDSWKLCIELLNDEFMDYSFDLNTFGPSSSYNRTMEKSFTAQEAKEELKEFEETYVDSTNEEFNMLKECYENILAVKEDELVRSDYNDLLKAKEKYDKEIEIVKNAWREVINNPSGLVNKSTSSVPTHSTSTTSTSSTSSYKPASTSKKPVVLIIGIVLLVVGLIFFIVGISSAAKVNAAVNDNSISFSEASKIIDQYTGWEVVGFLFGIPDLIAGLILTIIGAKKAKRR